MTPERWQHVKALLHSALECKPDERAAFLAEACGDDETLREDLQSLLVHEDRAGSFIEQPAFGIMAETLTNEQTSNLVGRTIGRYRIIAVLGSGGMGEVYAAEDIQLGRKIALKILPSHFTMDHERVRRFQQEARAASALNHPNIITIYEIGQIGFLHYMVTELIEGETLRQHMAKTQLAIFEALDIAAQVTSALATAHKAGIVHRDIKPENIMLRADGIAKVLDFGLAKLTERRVSDAEATRQVDTGVGVVMGTAEYMSPEQARGIKVDARSDIFSLGVVLYEMVTCRKPFEGASVSHVMVAILEQTPPALAHYFPEVPTELERIVTKALAKDRAERYQAIKDLEFDLKNLRQEVEFQTKLAHVRQSESSGEVGPAMARSPRHTVGREQERAALRAGFEFAVAGHGLLVCVSGEPGIGKTTLVEDSLAELVAEGRCTVARGICSERLAGTEAYLPLLEALESFLQGRSSHAATRVMKQVAPTWYAQLAPVASENEEAARLINEIKAASQERMKRELGAFLLEVSRLRPLVLFLDDLHWADVSTIDLLSFLAGKFEALRMLIVVTYRPSDMLLLKHPFLQIKPDLQARGVCRELALGFLTEAEIAQYLALEFPGHRFPPEFPQLIHLKTEGSPLFMADLVRYLLDCSVIAQANGEWTLVQALPEIERELPESVRGMIERKIAQLSEEDRRLLVVASVQGYEFDSAVVAQVLSLEADEVEERLEKLERVDAFARLVSERELPDGRLTLRYRFVHVLYQNALYGSLRATRKLALSREVAQALEGFYGEQRASVASELAALWEAAREYARAAEYFRLAAQQASQVFATQEAAALARQGLRMIEMLTDSRERREQELSLQVVLGNALVATKGYATPEVEQAFFRARELVQQLGETQHLLPALWGLLTFNAVRGQQRKALAYSEEFLRLSERLQDPAVLVGHNNVGVPLYFLGELEQAYYHLQRSASLYTAAQHRILTWHYGHEPGMVTQVYLSWTRWLLGHPDQALAHCLETLRLGKEVSHANSQAYALTCAAVTYLHCGDWPRVGELAEEAVAFSAEQGLPLWLGAATVARGWVMVGRGESAEGIEEIRRGIAVYQSTGAEVNLTYALSLLAEAYGKAGQPREGLAVLDEARVLVEKNEERFWEAELYRLRGELLVGVGGVASEVEACFHQAIEVARRQGAKSLELRAVMSLSRLWQRQGKRAEARPMLAEIYGWFTEGFDTADLREANALIDGLS